MPSTTSRTGSVPPPVVSRRGAAAAYSVERATTEAELATLEGSWNRLSETSDSPNIFSTFHWFHEWNQHFSAGDKHRRRRPEVLLLKAGEEVVGISPLVLRKASGLGFVLRKLEFLEIGADYNDLVIGSDRPRQIHALVDHLLAQKDRWDLVDLLNLRATGEDRAAIEDALSRTGLPYRLLKWGRCPYGPIGAPWSELVKKLSYASRRTFRNQQHRLQRLQGDGLRVRIIDQPGSAELDVLIRLERQKRAGGKPAASFFGRYKDVFESLFASLGSRGWLCLAVMEMGDRPIACQLVFRCGKKLWDYFTAYDHSFSRLSPGTMLIPAILDHGFAHGYDEYDFLRGEESYKFRWSTACHETYRLVIWKRGWRSRARAFAYLDLKEQVYRRFPVIRRAQ